MVRFMFGLLFLSVAVGLYIFKIKYAEVPDSQDRYGTTIKGSPASVLSFRKLAAIPLALGLLFVFWSMIRIVPPRSVGVETTLGKVTNSYDSGVHFTKPWSAVHKFPATINTFRLQNDGNGAQDEGPCITVRLGNQQTACVNVTTQWSVNTSDKKAVELLYARWRSFGHIEPNLIRPQLQHALLPPFETFDPLQTLRDGGSPTVPTAQLEQAARAELVGSIGNGITIQTLTINLVQYDQTTQDKLNSYAQAVADTRIAEQHEQTSAATAKANEALAAAGASQNQSVLYQNCLDMTERLAKEGKSLPAAWSCGTPPQSVVNVR